MKPWVAVAAALLALAAMVILPIQSSYEIASSETENLLAEIERTCLVVGEHTADADNARRQDVLSRLKLSEEMKCGLFQTDGAPLYCTPVELDLPRKANLLLEKADGQVHVFQALSPSGIETVYALYRYPDDHVLAVAIDAVTWQKILFSDRGLLATMMVMIAAVMLLYWVWFSMTQRDRMISNVLMSLDRFAEGDYDARITAVPGKDRQTAEFNAIVARIQQRVFRQRTRNEAMGVLMNQMQNGIIAVDQDLKVIIITPVAKRLLGVHGNLEGRQIDEVTDNEALTEVFREAMRQEGIYTNEVAARTTMLQDSKPIRLYVSPMRSEDKVVGALAMIEDISELKRLEQVRTDFAANVSHELKTPLTSIRGFVETLDAGAIDNPEMAHKFLHIIMMETERLTRLINDILSISKLESGNDEVAIERICLNKVASDVCEMLAIHAADKQVTIHNQPGGDPVYIMGNPDRVEQMLINLVENAIKYNRPEGSVTVQVFVSGKEAFISVSDTGIGIAEEDLPRLFERFYRVDKGRSRAMGGTGLGLAIVKHIVHSMKGEIEVHSKLGEGTEFLITLPVAPEDDPDRDTIFDRREA